MSYIRKKFLKFINKTQTHRISYILDGATLPKNTRYVFTEEDTFTLPIPTKKDYTFIEWQTVDGKKVDVLPKGTKSDVTFVAKFQPVLSVVAAMTSSPESGEYYRVGNSATFTVTIRNTTNRIINNIILTNTTNGFGAVSYSSSMGEVNENRYIIPSLAIEQEVGITIEQVIDRKDAITGGNKVIMNNVNINYDENINVKFGLPNIKAEREYILTIKYIYEETKEEALPARVSKRLEGERYSYMTPLLDGYAASHFSVKGIMPNKDLTIEVIYSKSTFTINDKQYQGAGMVWRDWCNTSFGSDFACDSGGYVHARNRMETRAPEHIGMPYVRYANNQYVTMEETINSKEKYITKV